MSADLKNSETLKNLMRAFAGESQEGSIRLVISGGDSAKPLDFLEKTLH